eukprot:12936117-Ditylum_brightwellii.AAC.1
MTFMTAFMPPSTMTMILSLVILGLPRSFSSMTSIAFCHRIGEKPSLNGSVIMMECTKLMLSNI